MLNVHGVYDQPITSRYLCLSPLALSITIIRWKQMDVPISNSHLCAFQKRQSHHPRVIKPNQELGVNDTTVKHYTWSRKTANALTVWNTVQHDIWGNTPGFSQHIVKLCVATNLCELSAGVSLWRYGEEKSPIIGSSSVWVICISSYL